ncbi:hypothetical protein C8Q75DRAFT_298961 [Abortiporus biennis]|nr:hypothetical protein C8Q75DRAFT_298961 [Abortiporus biennis]
MRFTTFCMLSGLLTAVSAHFQLQYPVPRGVFVEDNEPTFCDGYNTAASNRSEFPLSGGFISINSEHPQFTVGVQLSTLQNPTSFQNFSTAVNFFQASGEGPFCFPIDLTAAGASSGANATLQIIFDGGDGQLYQCADVIVSNNFNIPSDVSCTNATTSSSTTTSGSSAPSATSPTSSSGSASSSQTASSASSLSILSGVSLLSMMGAVVALL